MQPSIHHGRYAVGLDEDGVRPSFEQDSLGNDLVGQEKREGQTFFLQMKPGGGEAEIGDPAQLIEVLLLEDHASVREGLRLLIENEPDMRVVEEASDVAGAVQSETEPDVVVTDLMLPDASGPAAISALSNRFSNSNILVLTVVDSPVQMDLCLTAGARGYLLKEVAVRDLIKAIRRVNAGELILDPSLPEGLAVGADTSTLRSSKLIAYRLAQKELELVRLIALGHTNAEAANILKVSPRTVESRRSQILSKLGLKSRAELIKWAMEQGIVDG